MATIAICLVITSGLLHAVWNLFTKRSLNKAAFLWFIQFVAVITYLPWAIIAILTSPIPAAGWGLLVIAVAAHSVYVILLAKTYTAGDLSQVYPLMRGMSPLLVPLIGVLLLGERLPWIGWLGVISIVSGIWMIGNWRSAKHTGGRQLASRGTRLALCVGLSITLYTTLDKLTLQYIPAVTLTNASNLGNLIALSWIVIRSQAVATEWRANWRTILVGGIISPGGYLLFLLALRILPLAQLAPMREIGTVFGTVLGVFILKESDGSRRLSAATLITTGVILLGVFG